MEQATAQHNAVAIAVMQTEIAYVKATMARMETETAARDAMQSADLKAIRKQLDEATGGFRLLLLIGGAAGALLSWAVGHFKP